MTVPGMAGGWLVHMWDVSNVDTEYLLCGCSTLHESRLGDHLGMICSITEMFIPANIYHHIFIINDLNTNSSELQNKYYKEPVNISHICGINNLHEFKTTLATLPSDYSKQTLDSILL